MTIMRIGVLTGGGDVPGLNTCVKTLVRQAALNGWEVLGFRLGWAGPLNYNPDDDRKQDQWLERLTPEVVRIIDRSGGTYLHSSRTNPQNVKLEELPGFLPGCDIVPSGNGSFDCTKHVLAVLEHLGIDVLIAIGGDDTLSYATHLHRQGVRVLAIPKTMDNDVYGTDYCIGFSTAVTRSIEYINALRSPTGSHERIAVIELFGRYSGETALISGYLSDADRILISEVPVDSERLAELVTADRLNNPSRYAIVVISEGTQMLGEGLIESGEIDAYGHPKLGGIGQVLCKELSRLTGVSTLMQQLAYLMRAGPPDSMDHMVALSFGHQAIQFLESNKTGQMLAIRDGCYASTPIETCMSGEKRVDVDELYDCKEYRAKIRHLTGKPMFLY